MIGHELERLTDDELWNTQLFLSVFCGRSKSSWRKKRRQYICGLFETLKLEADLRGVPSPLPPFHVGDTKGKL